MTPKALGSTGRSVPAIGQGAGDFFWNAPISDTEKIAVLRAGLDAGMRLIDTSEGYGAGRSEELVAQAVTGRRPEAVVASKVSPEHHSHDDVIAAAEKSLSRLKVEAIDLYQTHWPNPAIPVAETMRALQKLHRDGKIRAAGIGNCSLKGLEEAEKALAPLPVSSIQTEYNLFERTIEHDGTLDYCRKKKISVIAYSPLDQGQFAQIDASQMEALKAPAVRLGKTPSQVILRWLVRDPQVLAITRTTKAAHAAENAAAMGFDLTLEEEARISEAFPSRVVRVPADRIRVSVKGEWNRPVYQTIDEARENKLGFVPSPEDLAREILEGHFLKPVRLVPAPAGSEHDYELVAGRVRYWAFVIARGRRAEIPAYVRRAV